MTREGVEAGLELSCQMHSLPCGFLVVLAYLSPHLMTMTTRISYDEFAMSTLLAHSWLAIARFHVLTRKSCLESEMLANGNFCDIVLLLVFLCGQKGSFFVCPFLFIFSHHLVFKILIPGDLVFLGLTLACCLYPRFCSFGFCVAVAAESVRPWPFFFFFVRFLFRF